MIYEFIISESFNVSDNSYTEYKAFGEFKIYRDYYNKSKKLVKHGKLEEAFGKTSGDAIKQLAINNNFEIAKDEFVINDKREDDNFLISDRLRIEGQYYCDNNQKRINLDENPELYEKWKSGKISLILYTYFIYLDKLISQPVTNAEEYDIINAFK